MTQHKLETQRAHAHGFAAAAAADIVTGEIVRKLEYHREVVRDLHWHPDQPMLVTTSFDGSVVKWDTRDTLSEEDERKAARRHRLPDPGTDQLDSYY